MEIMVGGCLAQKDRDLIAERAAHVDVVFGTHNVHRAVELLARAHGVGRSGRGDPRGDRAPRTTSCSPRPCRCAARSVTRRGSPSRSAATTAAPSASCPRCAARRSAARSATLVAEVERLAADGVTEVTLLGQNVNSYGRDLTPGYGPVDRRRRRARPPARRESGPARPGGAPAPGRCSPTCCGAVGAVDGIRRVRYTSPHPKDLRPETIAAMADVRPRCASTCTCPLQSGSDRVLAAMHRGYTAERYLERLAAGPGRHRRPRRHHRHHRRLPRRDRRRLRRHARGGRRGRGYDNAFTFVYSPRPGTEAAATLTAHFVAARRGGAAHVARLRAVVERSAARPRGPDRPDRGGAGGGPAASATRSALTGRTRHNRLVHFPSPDRCSGPARYAEVLVTEAATTTCVGELVEVLATPRHRTRIPVGAG